MAAGDDLSALLWDAGDADMLKGLLGDDATPWPQFDSSPRPLNAGPGQGAGTVDNKEARVRAAGLLETMQVCRCTSISLYF